jgi:predicted HTH domain antitoxin
MRVERQTLGVAAMSQMPVMLDKDVIELLGDSPEQIERAALEIIVLDLYRRHEISGGRAAELLGLEKLAFIRWSGSLGIPYFDMTPEQWEHEVRSIKKA